MTCQYTIIATDWGYAGLAASTQGFCRSLLPLPAPDDIEAAILNACPNASYRKYLHRQLQTKIRNYFAGQLEPFDPDIPLDLGSARPFTRTILLACRQIPLCQTRTYGELAQQAGSPQAARAVGGVMAKNPLPLLVPCHRVLGRNGHLTGFTAPGGVELKQRLLDHEQRKPG